MCGNINKHQYIKESCRYDKKTYNMLNEYLKTGVIEDKYKNNIKKVNYACNINICYLNSTRKRINEIWSDIHIEKLEKNKEIIDMRFKYQGQIERYKISNKMPIICTKNFSLDLKDEKKKKNFYNGEFYKIQHIDLDNSTKKIANEKDYIIEIINEDDKKIYKIDNYCLGQNFNLGYGNTVYKFQGSSIKESYNIFDIEKMCKKELYTALSRCTKFYQIHINKKMLKQQYFVKTSNEHKICKIGKNEFQNGKIYKIEFKNSDNIYIGSTIESLKHRLSMHLKTTASVIYKNKHNLPKISLISSVPTRNRNELEKIEKEYIKIYYEKYGEKLLNKKDIPFNTVNQKRIKKLKWSFTMENEDALKNRIYEKTEIKDFPNSNILSILKINEKTGKFKQYQKKYNPFNKQNIMKSMLEVQMITRKKMEEENMKILI